MKGMRPVILFSVLAVFFLCAATFFALKGWPSAFRPFAADLWRGAIITLNDKDLDVRACVNQGSIVVPDAVCKSPQPSMAHWFYGGEYQGDLYLGGGLSHPSPRFNYVTAFSPAGIDIRAAGDANKYAEQLSSDDDDYVF